MVRSIDFLVSRLVARESKMNDFWRNIVERYQMTVVIWFSQYTDKMTLQFQWWTNFWNPQNFKIDFSPFFTNPDSELWLIIWLDMKIQRWFTTAYNRFQLRCWSLCLILMATQSYNRTTWDQELVRTLIPHALYRLSLDTWNIKWTK